MTRALLALAALSAVFLASTAGAAAPGAPTTIAGADLPHPVRLAAADADAFVRRINLPPLLDEAPETRGAAYTIASPYWDDAFETAPRERPAVADAVYYPEGGFVRASRDDEEMWLVLDLRQQAILDRYIRLDRANRLPAEPGVVDVLRAAAQSGEDIDISVAGRELSAAERGRLWDSLASTRRQPLAAASSPTLPAAPSANAAWLVFGLPEARSLQLLYSLSGGVLIDYTAAEFYPVPARWLETLLGPDFAEGGRGYAAIAIDQDRGSGSPLWWVVMAGGGVALVAAAYWLSRRTVDRSSSEPETSP